MVLLWATGSALAGELLIVQSGRDRAAGEIRKSVTRAVAADTELLLLSDYAEVDLPRIVREEQPDLVLTIGEAAFKAARKIRGVPLVAVMALSLGSGRSIPANVTGIDIRIDPIRYMTLFSALGLKRIGVAYDPAQSGAYLAKAQHAAALTGIELALRPAKSPREALKSLGSLKGSASDGIWLVPDPTTVTALTLEANFSLTLEEKKPIISYAGEHIRKGAAVTLNPDWARMGSQTSDMVRKILNGAAPREIPPQFPHYVTLGSNENVLKHLGIPSAKLERLFPKTKD